MQFNMGSNFTVEHLDGFNTECEHILRVYSGSFGGNLENLVTLSLKVYSLHSGGFHAYGASTCLMSK
jgi:hypothetical protein